jgi:hypothetical protein
VLEPVEGVRRQFEHVGKLHRPGDRLVLRARIEAPCFEDWNHQ